MDHTITLQVSEDLYQAIWSQAVERGQTPANLVTEWLTKALCRAEAAEQDPLLKLFGTLSGAVTDVAERHDHYVSQAISHELRDG